jgi:acetyltransferase
MSAAPSAWTDEGSVSLRDGRVVQIRPSRPEDVEKLLELHAALSPATRQARYFTAGGTKRQVDAERLAKADGSRDVVLVATVEGGEQIVAVGELARVREQAELALVVRDDYQEVGLGGHLFPRLLLAAQEQGLQRVELTLLGGNQRILQLVRRHNSRLRQPEHGVVYVTIDFGSAPPTLLSGNVTPAA